MTIEQLRTALQPRDGKLTITESTLDRPLFDELIRTCLQGASIEIDNATLNSADGADKVIVTGTTTCLKAPAQLTATFSFNDDDQPEAYLKFRLPKAWTFTQTFEQLPTSVDFSQTKDSPRTAILDRLMQANVLTDVDIILTTDMVVDAETQQRMYQGLNLTCKFSPRGPLKALQTLFGDAALTLSGPIRFPIADQSIPARKFGKLPDRQNPTIPGIHLKVDLPGSLALGKMIINGCHLGVYTPLSADWLADHADYAPTLALGGDMQIRDALGTKMLAEFPLGADTVTLQAAGGIRLPDPAVLVNLTGASIFETYLPQVFQTAGQIELLNLLVEIDTRTDPFAIPFVSLTIGMPALRWDAIENLVGIEDIAVDVAVNQPFADSLRSVNVTLSGKMAIAGVPIAATACLPGFFLTAQLQEDQQIPLGAVMQHYLPGIPLPDGLLIGQLTMRAKPGDYYALSMALAAEPSWSIGSGPNAIKIEDVHLDLKYAGNVGTSGRIRGTIDLTQDIRVPLEANLSEVLELQATAADIDLLSLLNRFLPAAIALPEELPNVVLDTIDISTKPKTGAFSLHGTASGAWSMPPIGDGGLEISQVDMTLARTVAPDNDTFKCTITVSGETKRTLADGLEVEHCKLVFDLMEGQTWTVGGEVHVRLMDQAFALKAAYAHHNNQQVIQLALAAGQTITLIDIENAGGLSIRHLALALVKDAAAGTPQTTFDISANGRITIGAFFDFTGQLKLYSNTEGKNGLIFIPDKATLDIPLIGDQTTGTPTYIEIGVDGLAIARQATRDSRESTWALSAGASLKIKNIPAIVDQYLPPEKLSGQFETDGKTVALTFDVPSTLQPVFPELALTFANDVTLSLGQPQIRVMAIELQLGDQPRLVQKLRVTLPRQLSHLFGRDDQGNPNLDLFNDEFEMHLVLAKRLGLVLATSPLKPLTFYAKEGDDGLWTDWDFGPVGRISFRVPEFAYDAGRWRASGGFDRLTDLGLPLTPLKFLLAQSGFPPALISPLPDAIPLKDVDLTGDNFGREMKLLLGDQVLGRLDKNASAVLDELYDAMTAFIDRLPTRLQEYLQIRIPESAIFEISVDTAGGGCSLGLRTLPGDPALKFLFPMMLGVPELVGFSLRGLSVGQKLGGSLMQIEIDGHIDRFDMVSLIAALTLDRRDIANRYIMEKTLVLMPTGLPVPIPLFFSHLGLDYRDILGFDIQAHWSYPDPELGVFETISLFTDLLEFFKNPDYLLHKEGFAETLGLALTIGENVIALPEYLGGQTLGLQKALPALSVGDSVARFLDFLKTGNAGYAITAIPLRHEDTWIRIGRQEIRFGPLVIGMSWCITTDEEFVDVLLPASRQHGGLPMDFDAAVLESLPTEGGKENYRKGFIILLMGHAELGGMAGLRTEFGMAVTAQGGFETGFRMAGEIGRALALSIGGRIQATEERVTIEGRTGLYWKDQPLVTASGGITVSDTALEVEIKIELSPFFSVEGLLVIGKQGMLMEGRAAWGHGADGSDQGIGASVAFSRDGMTIGFDMRLISFDAQVTVRVPGDGGSSLFAATVRIEPDMALQENFARDIKSLAQSTAESSVNQIYNDLQKAIAAVDSLEISVAGLRQWLPPLCDRIIATITRTINDNTTGWKRPGRSTAHNKAKPYIRRLATLRDVARKASDRNFRPRLKAALQDIVNHNRLNITVGIPSVRWKKNRWGIRYPSYYTRHVSVYRRDLMNAKQLGQLRQAIGWVDALPDKEGLKIETQAIYDQLPDRDKLLAQIDREIGQGVDGALPQVESIAFRTSLELLNLSDLEVIVHYRRSGKRLTAQTTLDLTNPAKSTQQLIDAFGRGSLLSKIN